MKPFLGKRKTVLILYTIFSGAAVLALLGGLFLRDSRPGMSVALLYGCMLAVGALFLLLCRGEKRWRQKLVGLFLFTLCCQLLYSLFMPLTGESDLRFYFGGAVSYARDGFAQINLYRAVFPTTATYPAFLAIFMRIFGVHRLVPVIINHLAISGLACMTASFCKRRMSADASRIVGLVLVLQPYILIYSNTCNAELLFGFLTFAAFSCAFKGGGGIKWFADMRGCLLRDSYAGHQTFSVPWGWFSSLHSCFGSCSFYPGAMKRRVRNRCFC